MIIKSLALVVVMLFTSLLCLSSCDDAGRTVARPQVVEAVEIEPVWAGHRVDFCLLTHGEHQFAAYYDAERRMTVAGRRLGEKAWTIRKLDSTLGWDSHNYVTMAIDRRNYLHVSGNMHSVPIVYFRSEEPLDVTSLRRVPAMTGEAEQRATYPRFFHAPDGALLYMYRDGGSGNGRRLINRYDETIRTWSRYLDTHLLDGTGMSMNAYPASIRRGPEGFYHLVWMWRETRDCRSNLNISYARSRDLKNWETAGSKPISLPITPKNLDVVVDPTPANRGMINLGFGVGFDTAHRAVIHYHNYDPNGYSQIFLARWENQAWAIRQVSDWAYRWDFHGAGTIEIDLRADPVNVLPDGRLVQSWSHIKYGSGTWLLDPETLKVTGEVMLASRYPSELDRPLADFPGLSVRWAFDEANDPNVANNYALRWESLGGNRDRPPLGPVPSPVMLMLYRLSDGL